MKLDIIAAALLSLSLVTARPVLVKKEVIKREVPQEHSHEQFLVLVKTSLDLNNPDEIQDSVFGLLGNAAAATGAGKIADPECLQQATADQAFTNAKAAADVNGQVAALIYRTLERNTGSVGLKSNSCATIQAVNPEIAALSQHQDPASDGAAAANKAIVLELAKQIAAVGGDPQDALKSGTFEPGQIGDPTGAGNTCDTLDDPVGCIFTLNRLVEDATAAEIDAAVAGAGAAGAGAAGAGAGAVAAECAAQAAAAANATANAGAGAADAAANNQNDNAGAAAGATSQSLDLGSCGDPTIIFAVNLDGRRDPSFQAVNLVDFNHGSALNIGVISNFICDRLKSTCQASAAAITACEGGVAAASAAKGQAAADAFNAAFL